MLHSDRGRDTGQDTRAGVWLDGYSLSISRRIYQSRGGDTFETSFNYHERIGIHIHFNQIRPRIMRDLLAEDGGGRRRLKPPWRRPRGKCMVSLVDSHTNATSKRWHLWEINLKFALNSTPGWREGSHELDQAKARIWPCLLYVCHIRSTAEPQKPATPAMMWFLGRLTLSFTEASARISHQQPLRMLQGTVACWQRTVAGGAVSRERAVTSQGRKLALPF